MLFPNDRQLKALRERYPAGTRIRLMIEYNAEYNEYIVWVGKPDIYKAFFDADTLECTGTKC